MNAALTSDAVATNGHATGDGGTPAVPSAVRTRGAGLSYGDRLLWQGLDLDIAPGQFVAILGSNGSGKTSLLKVLLGEQQLTHGRAWVGGEPVRRGSTAVGYVPARTTRWGGCRVGHGWPPAPPGLPTASQRCPVCP